MEKIKELFRTVADAVRNIRTEIDFYKNLWDKPQ